MTIPIRTPKPKSKPKRRLSDLIKFSTKAPPKKSKPPARPSEGMPKGEKKSKRSVSSGLAEAASMMSGRGTAGRILKGVVSGAAAGAKIEESYRQYKKERSRSKAKKVKTTVSQAAMSRFHKKDPTSTEKH